MSTQHSKKAAVFLKNKTYAKWHDTTFWAVRTKRDNMAQGLDEWEQLREKASQIKRHTITHLDEYLDQFSTNAEKNGAIVHWAKDAQEFNEIVYGILECHNQTACNRPCGHLRNAGSTELHAGEGYPAYD